MQFTTAVIALAAAALGSSAVIPERDLYDCGNWVVGDNVCFSYAGYCRIDPSKEYDTTQFHAKEILPTCGGNDNWEWLDYSEGWQQNDFKFPTSS